jgi:hypothetical protein
MRIPALSELKVLDLDAEKREISRIISSGITPSTLRLTDYISACFVQGGKEEGMSKAISCLSELFRSQEENAVEADPQLVSFLFFMDSDKL